MDKLIFHIDVNSAFLSWEAVYRLKNEEEVLDLRTIPSAVGGDRESRHGIILAKSIPAKAYGIHTAETIVSALNKCPDLVLVPARFEVYHRYSIAFMEILSRYSPDMEQLSIDEAFLDMTGTCHLFGEPMDVAAQIKNQIRDELGFTVNVGVSTNRILAKMASDFKKPDLCHSLFPEEIKEKMWVLPVGELYFVGRSAQKKMELLDIHTIGDLANYDVRLLMSNLGNKYGRLIHEYANGIGDNRIEMGEISNKGYSNSVTLSHDVDSYDTACQILLSLSETVGTRLRKDQVKCNSITVEIKDVDFASHSHQMTLAQSTNITDVIYEKSCLLLKEFWNGKPLRLLGIRTAKLSEEDFTQISLFEQESDAKLEKLEKLDAAIDSIRNRFGTDAINRASIIKKKHNTQNK